MAGRKRSNLVQKTVYVTRGGKTFQKKTRNISGNHPKQDVFEQKVMPLIDRFFKENDSILKSLRIGVFNV